VTEFVLIHSTGQGAAGWDRVVRALADRGHTAHAVELPDDPDLAAADYAELMSQQVGDVPAPVVLAHSGSGQAAASRGRAHAGRAPPGVARGLGAE
jgi:pimeloyl-ACP methyl ester carboxylesterase